MSTQSILAEFRKEFTYVDEDENRYLLGGYDKDKNINTDNIPQIESFLEKAINEAKEEERKELIDEIRGLVTLGETENFTADGLANYLYTKLGQLKREENNMPTLTEKIKEIVYHDSDVDKLLSLIQSTVKGCVPEEMKEISTKEYMIDYPEGFNACLDTITANLKEKGVL